MNTGISFWQMVLAMLIAHVIWDCLKLLFKWRVQWVRNNNNHYRVIWPMDSIRSEHSDIPN